MQLLIGHGQVPTIMPEASKKLFILRLNALNLIPMASMLLVLISNGLAFTSAFIIALPSYIKYGLFF